MLNTTPAMSSFPDGALEPLEAIIESTDLRHPDFDGWREIIDKYPVLNVYAEDLHDTGFEAWRELEDKFPVPNVYVHSGSVLVAWLSYEDPPVVSDGRKFRGEKHSICPDGGFARALLRHFETDKLRNGSWSAFYENRANGCEALMRGRWSVSMYETPPLGDIDLLRSRIEIAGKSHVLRFSKCAAWETRLTARAVAQSPASIQQVAVSTGHEIRGKGSNEFSADLQRRRKTAIEWLLTLTAEDNSAKQVILKMMMSKFRLSVNAAQKVWDDASKHPDWDQARSRPGRKSNRKAGR